MRLVRKIATPFRQYVNRHFEMVKDEVRGQHEVARVQLAEIGSRFDASIQRADAMAETAAAAQTELQFFVGRQMAEVRTELGGLRSVEGELRTLEARLRAMEDRLVESGLAMPLPSGVRRLTVPRGAEIEALVDAARRAAWTLPPVRSRSNPPRRVRTLVPGRLLGPVTHT